MHGHTDINFSPLVNQDAVVWLRVAPTALSCANKGNSDWLMLINYAMLLA